MTIEVKRESGAQYALVKGEGVLVYDVQSALDIMMTVHYESGLSRMAIRKEALAEDFFILSTRFAGEVLQKFVNYRMKLAVIGDFSKYTSKPLRDFIYESNKGNAVFFVSSEDEAAKMLSGV